MYERSAVGNYISSNVGDGYFDILDRKSKMRNEVEKVFLMIRHTLGQSQKASQPEASEPLKVEVKQRYLRTCKIILCHEYCMDILARICCDSMKLQLLHETDSLRKRAYLLSRDSMFLELSRPCSGEHEFAAYNEDH